MRRQKRNAFDDAENQRGKNENEEVYRLDLPSEMHYLLHLSRAIDDVRLSILNEQPPAHDRSKREAVDHITTVIQVYSQ